MGDVRRIHGVQGSYNEENCFQRLKSLSVESKQRDNKPEPGHTTGAVLMTVTKEFDWSSEENEHLIFEIERMSHRRMAHQISGVRDWWMIGVPGHHVDFHILFSPGSHFDSVHDLDGHCVSLGSHCETSEVPEQRRTGDCWQR